MSKPSGWEIYRRRYGKGERAKDNPEPASAAELTEFAETSKGPIRRQLFNLALIDYSAETGEIEVNTAEVKAQAREYVKYTQDASNARGYLVQAYRDVTPGAEQLSEKAAEAGLNRHEAAKAKAILLAARVGRVKLTDAQLERLGRVAKGEYLDLVYSQYKSGSSGTLTPMKKKFTGATAQSVLYAEERKRAFYENVLGRRID
jgi:hypothetical protein